MAVLDKNKLLPQGKKGGALARPKSSLVPSKSLSSNIAKVEPVQESPTLIIKTKLIKIEDLLKGTLALEKKEADDKRKELEEEKRQKQEDQIEGAPKTKEKKFRMPVPKKVTSFFDDIKRYIGTVLMGWLVVRLVKFLPKLMPILKFLGGVADFLIEWGGKLLDGLVTLVDWGYKAAEWTRGAVENVFGQDGVKKFDAFTGTLTKMMNLMIILGMAAGKVRGPKGKKPKFGDDLDVDPKTKKKVKPDEIVDPKTNKVRKKTNLEIENQKKYDLSNKQLDEVKLKKKKINPQTGKKFTNADAIADVKKPKGFAKFFGGVKDLGGKGLKLAGTGLKTTGKLALKLGKGLLNSLPNFSQLGDELAETLGNSYNTLKKTAQKRYDQVVDVAKKLKGKYDNALKSAGSYLSGLGEKAKQAFLEKVLAPVKKLLEPLVKKIQPIGDKIMGVLKKIPGYDKITKVLQKFGGAGSEGLLKKIGGKAIPVIGGVVNMAFAYDRLAAGDSIGGMIEGLSGLLDLSALVGNAAGPGISMGLDAYMFARDFVPQIQGAEDAVVSKLGLMGLKTSMDSIFEKLPGLGEIAKMITGGDKEEEVVDTKKGEVEGKTPPLPKTNKDEVITPKKIDKTFKMGKKEYDLSKSMGGLSREEYDALDSSDRNRLNRRMSIWQGQNKKEWADNIKGNANNIVSTNGISNKVSGVSSSASYEDSVEVIDGQEAYDKGYSDGSTGEEKAESTEQKVIPVVMGESGGTDAVSEQLYAGG